ncbi:MAG: heme NO-binding domain-containing protein [Deltaproteobacteria bacterium]|nr:heme NO-binding domain-containing protein [Deltaproteobacteria bacterium]
MHGIIFRELKKYVVDKHGKTTWTRLLVDAGIDGKVFLPIQTYVDAEMLALVAGAAKESGVTANELLEYFGAFIVADLLQTYRSAIVPDWKTLELLEHTEAMIHRVVRQRDPTAQPPALDVQRTGPSTLTISYSSARKLCALARGIIRGVAEHYAQRVQIEESTCMLRDDPQCTLNVTVH